MVEPSRIPEATVARLPAYLRALAQAAERGMDTISSDGLADAAGVGPANVRKDLSHLGSYGTRGVGYRVDELLAEISEVLGVAQDLAVAIVGMGNLGRALASYGGFGDRGFQVAALIDADPDAVGTTVAGLTVESFDRLSTIVDQRDISIAVVATPAGSAQAVAEELVDSGVAAILNFAPTHLSVPESVTVRKVDLSSELQILAFYQQLHDRVDVPASRDLA